MSFANAKYFDLIQDVKEYIYAVCMCDRDLSEKISRFAHENILEDKKSGEELSKLLKETSCEKIIDAFDEIAI